MIKTGIDVTALGAFQTLEKYVTEAFTPIDGVTIVEQMHCFIAAQAMYRDH